MTDDARVVAARKAFEKQAHESLVGRPYTTARIWYTAGYLDAAAARDAAEVAARRKTNRRNPRK